ncbi:hypothetical protein [Shewanella sp. SR44-3]|uniref:hypothetical protein n=1 Tax=unclassified Shewanella TaxID=196818 RepID=UPI0015FB7040|nr:hypothetical protein [Shewanella sp. SR44-3]MBB1269931.1 hypothetical protein [Shewanella sp. SR44-3]
MDSSVFQEGLPAQLAGQSIANLLGMLLAFGLIWVAIALLRQGNTMSRAYQRLISASLILIASLSLFILTLDFGLGLLSFIASACLVGLITSLCGLFNVSAD